MEANLDLFWEGLSSIQKIYWIVAIPSSLMFLIMFVMSLIGKDSHFEADDSDLHDTHTGDGDISQSFSGYIFSFKTIISFLTAASWTGIASLSSNMTIMVVLIISIASGVVLMFMVAGLLYLLTGLTYSGTMEFHNAIGAVGDVYITIPALKKGHGQVQVVVQGTLRTLSAMTEDEDPIPGSTQIEVVDVLENQILLVKRKR